MSVIAYVVIASIKTMNTTVYVFAVVTMISEKTYMSRIFYINPFVYKFHMFLSPCDKSVLSMYVNI